jgi:hypothetical protein
MSFSRALRTPRTRRNEALGWVDLEDVIHDVFVQLDAIRDERVERKDSSWWPPGGDPENVEQLVADRWRRGVLYLPHGSRQGGAQTKRHERS